MSDVVVLNDEAKQVSSTIVSYNPDVIADRLVTFSEMVTSIKLYGYQKEFAYRLAYSLVVNDGEEITALWSRQSGKTESVSVILVGAMVLLPVLAEMFVQLEHYKNGLWVGVFAPIMEQANTMYERICSRVHSEVAEEILMDPDIQTKVVGHGAKLENGSNVRVMSASKQSNIESKSFHIVIVDECQDVSEFKMLKSIHPMIAAYNGTIVKIGTPNGQKCEFLDAINRNKRKDLNVPNRYHRNHFEFDYKVCQESNAKYKKFIEREIERFGEDGDYFRMAYRLHWMIEIGVFITEEKLDQCLNKSFDMVKSDHESVCVFGLDIGKSNDSTVCTILALDVDNPDENGFYKKRILNWLEITGEDYEAQFWQVYDFLGEYKILRGCVDKTAVGDPIADRLYAQFESKDIEIVPITFSTQTKSQMYKYLLQEMQASRIIIPGCKASIKSRKYTKFRQQMIDLEKSWKGQYMVVNHPSARNAHDDYPDSIVLATWAGSEIFLREIDVYKGDVFHNREANPLFSRRADRTIFGGKRRTG